MSSNLSFASDLADVDWAFSNLSNEGVHSFHWYPATFISAIPGTLIPVLSKKGDLVLDPFCGTATTGVESIRLGRRFAGIDTNPIAILIAHAKLYAPESTSFAHALDPSNIRFRYSAWEVKKFFHPQADTLLKWYEQRTYCELAFLLDYIASIRNNNVRICAQAIFSSILKNVSSQTRHWGWVCDNVLPKSDELQYRNAIDAFESAVRHYIHSTDRLLQELRRRNGKTTRATIRSDWDLMCDDCIQSMRKFDNNSVDLVLSSPPYYGVADYIKAQRLSLLWFDHPKLHVGGYGYSDFDKLRRKETGSRSFRHRKTSFEQYISYMAGFFAQARRVLKPNSFLALVLGESVARAPTMQSLIRAAKNASLTCVYQSSRDIKQTRRRLMANVKGEDIVIFRAH